MKNLVKILFCLTFVFVLSKLEMGKGTVYLTPAGTSSTNIAEARVFQEIGDVYQTQLDTDGWSIVTQ